MQSFEDDKVKLKLDGLVPPLFQVVAALLHGGQEADVRDILLDLLDIAEHEPRLFKRNCREHLALLLAVMTGHDPSNPSMMLDSETRQSAMELVVTLVESRPGLVRKDEPQMRAICESLMNLLLEIEDTPLWHTAIEEEDLDDGAPSCMRARGRAPDACGETACVRAGVPQRMWGHCVWVRPVWGHCLCAHCLCAPTACAHQDQGGCARTGLHGCCSPVASGRACASARAWVRAAARRDR